MGVEVDRAVADLASRQDGIITRKQLAGIGLSDREIEALLRSRRLHRQHRGVYHVGHASLSDRARLRAALLAVGDHAALSRRTAAAHWEVLRWNGLPQLTTTARTGSKPPGLDVSRVRVPPLTTIHKGFRVTTVEQTLLDLATLVPPRQLSRALGEAEYHRILDRDALRDLARGRKGATAIRHALGDDVAPTHSSLEDAFLSLIHQAQLPRPITNAQLLGREVDFLWPRERVIVETDGWAAHGRRDAFDRDRARDLDFEARGYRTARISARTMRREPLAGLVRVGALLLGHSAATSHQ